MPYKDPAQARAYRAKNASKIKAYGKQPKERIAARERRRKQPYDPEYFQKRKSFLREREQKLREIAVGRPKPDACDACGGNDGGIVYDHSHTKGHPRGWLCNNCNVALGLVGDSADRLPQLVLPGL